MQKSNTSNNKQSELDHSQIQALLVPTKQKSSRIALRRQAKDGNRAIARLEQAGKISNFDKGLHGMQNNDNGKLSGKRSR